MSNVSATSTASTRPRSMRGGPRRRATTAAAALLVSTVAFGALPASGLGLGPAPAAATVTPVVAQSSSATSLYNSGGLIGAGSKSSTPKGLDAPADWNAPGVKQGIALIGWVKAAVIVLGVLGMMGGVVVGKVLKETGNHHASGARATALGIGAAMVIAGAAPTIVPQLVW